MKCKFDLILFFLSFELVKSRPNSHSEILAYENNIRPDGYDFKYQTSDGILRTEYGSYKPTGPEEGILTVNGDFSYKQPDGVMIFVSFVADENGYRPKIMIGSRAEVSTAIPVSAFAFENRKGVSSAAIASITGGGLGK